ncbi:hypothetical protein [Agromyces bauzanensis]|nr:hypothetical protein [Agromyces bauzanensis]
MATNQVQTTVEQNVLDEPCPRCGSTAVRAVVYTSSTRAAIDSMDDATVFFEAEDPLFDCRECGFEWGELIRDLMR